MSFTGSKELFLEEFEKVKSIIDIEKELPDQVFRKSHSAFLIIDFDEIFLPNFFRKIRTFLTSVGEREFSLLSIDPHPEAYFHRHFHKYPLIKFSIENTEDDFISMLDEDPGDSPADSVSVRTDRLVVYSDNFFIYGGRELELGVAVISDDSKIEDAFVSSYGKERIFSVDEAVDELLYAVFINSQRRVPQNIIDKLRLNYG